MDFFLYGAAVVIAVVAALLLAWSLWRRRRNTGRRGLRDTLDTLQDWPPEPARVMTVQDRQAYELLRRALPGYMVLAQVPLARFIRVPTRHSYSDWLQRVGSLSADLLVCDTGSRVLAVIDVRAADESERGRRRHERLARVLSAAGIRVHHWREGHLPTAAELRTALAHDLVRGSGPIRGAAASSRSMPLIPIPETQELDEVLAAGDAVAARDGIEEPVPSAFIDDHLAPTAPGRRV